MSEAAQLQAKEWIEKQWTRNTTFTNWLEFERVLRELLGHITVDDDPQDIILLIDEMLASFTRRGNAIPKT